MQTDFVCTKIFKRGESGSRTEPLLYKTERGLLMSDEVRPIDRLQENARFFRIFWDMLQD